MRNITYLIDYKDIRILLINVCMTGIQKRNRVLMDKNFNVYVYSEKNTRHHMPHCHLYVAEYSMVYDLINLEVLETNINHNKVRKEAIELLNKYRTRILQEYNKINV